MRDLIKIGVAVVNITRELDYDHDVSEAFKGVDNLVNICHTLASRAGWWEGKDVTNSEIFATKTALCHSELSEMLEGHRTSSMDKHLPHRSNAEVEMADLIIRAMDLAGAMKWDLAGAIMEKLEYNMHRADHKKEAREAVGGKKY